MKAITVWQPWASLVLVGAKPYEFRNSSYRRYINPPKAGERIAIHAGSRPVRRKEVRELVELLEEDDPEVNPGLHREIALPFLRRVLAGLTDRRPRAVIDPDASTLFDFGVPPRVRDPIPEVEPFVCPLSAILCTAVLGEPKRGDKCAAEFGRPSRPAEAGMVFNWGWPLLEIEPVIPHVEAKGAQGFWNWNPPSPCARAQGDAARIDVIAALTFDGPDGRTYSEESAA